MNNLNLTTCVTVCTENSWIQWVPLFILLHEIECKRCRRSVFSFVYPNWTLKRWICISSVSTLFSHFRASHGMGMKIIIWNSRMNQMNALLLFWRNEEFLWLYGKWLTQGYTDTDADLSEFLLKSRLEYTESGRCEEISEPFGFSAHRSRTLKYLDCNRNP